MCDLRNTLINGGNLQQAEFNTQDSCNNASTTGYRVCRAGTGYTALYTCFNNWLQSVPAGTGYTALYACFNNWLQSVPAGTGYTALYTCFNNWLQSVPTGTGYTVLYTCFNLPVTKSTNRVLATQSLELLTVLCFTPTHTHKKKKKKKKSSWLHVAQ